jgi:intracellular sulfur oxidation DsrE/DsrF family protein
MLTPRRLSLKALGIGLAAIGTAAAAPGEPVIPAGALSLKALTKHLAAAPRRRDYKSLPMILTEREQWDAEALDEVLHYAGGPKQSWDNTDLHGPWLNVMHNAMNGQIWSFRHPDFLCVSATHGPAQLALYDDAIWEKYGLAKLAGGGMTRNTLVAAPAAASADPADFENPAGAFSSGANSIETLQRRGAVFLACHTAIWELGLRLIATDANPDKLSPEAMCAELTNHLIPGVVVNPGAVATLVELAHAGFAYAR